MPKSVKSVTHSFSVDPAIIRSIIGAQAGSIEKAMMEAVANSIDAGATRIDVAVSPTCVRIRDNGAGLASKSEVKKLFGVFGFDHDNLTREHGRFGVGRGQLFCYGVNRWRTNTFELEVDVEHKGFDYDFRSNLPKVAGMDISIDLFKPLSLRDSYNLEEAFRDLIRYSVVPVFYNDKQISLSPQEIKWPQDSPDAWFDLKREGTLRLYSQGLLVDQTSRHGVGGVVVTRPGSAFMLNMARNDIVKDRCPVWGRVEKVLRAKARELGAAGAKRNTLTDSQRRAMAAEALSSGTLDTLIGHPLFTLSNGRHVNLQSLLSRRDWAVAPAGDRTADILLSRKSLYVFAPDTMARFGVDGIDELKQRLLKALDRIEQEEDTHPWTVKHYRQTLKEIVVHFDLSKFKDLVNLSFTQVKLSDLKSEEKAALHAIRHMGVNMGHIQNGLLRHQLGDSFRYRSPRTIRVMASESSAGMTDGLSNIWIERSQLKKARFGLSGFAELTTLLAHEYSHLESSQGSHGHDQAFYEMYHDLTRSTSTARLAVTGLGQYLRGIQHPTQTLIGHADMVFKGDLGIFLKPDSQELMDTEFAAFELAADPDDVAPAPKRTRKIENS